VLFQHYLFSSNKGKEYPVSQTMKYIKGATAREANLLLKKQGTFWQKESYDHYVRNDRELDNIINYILNNPVKAGLIEDWTQWPWTFLAGCSTRTP
jgi:putative transposase